MEFVFVEVAKKFFFAFFFSCIFLFGDGNSVSKLLFLIFFLFTFLLFKPDIVSFFLIVLFFLVLLKVFILVVFLGDISFI